MAKAFPGSFAMEESGQSTVEYAFVIVAFLALLLALGVLWHSARDGLLQRLAANAASHAFSGEGPINALQDICLF